MAAPGLLAARALLYGAALIAFGIPAYLVSAPAATRRWYERRTGTWRLVAGAGALGLAATLLHLALLAAAMNGVGLALLDGEMLRFVAIDLPVGRAALVRAVLLALLIAAVALPQGIRIAAAIGLGGGAVVTLIWNGHAMMRTGAAGWIHAAADAIHLAAAALWIGAVVALLRLAVARGDPARVLRSEAFAGFAQVGTVAVAALILTGLVNGAMVLDWRVPDGAGPYLMVLLAKLALFVAALALAANNRFRLTPRLGEGAAAQRALVRSVAIELVLLAVIVVAVALLGTMSPEG